VALNGVQGYDNAVKAILLALSEQAYALLRISSGFMFSIHGFQKIFGVLGREPSAPLTQAWIGGLIELLGGLMIMAGFWTRSAAFLSSGTMAVAYIQFHWKFQMGSAFFPAVNRGELAALYCFVFFFIATRGAGIWALKRGS